MKKRYNFNIIKILAYLSTLLAFAVSIWITIIVIKNISSYQQTEFAIIRQMKSGFGDLIAGTIGIFCHLQPHSFSLLHSESREDNSRKIK